MFLVMELYADINNATHDCFLYLYGGILAAQYSYLKSFLFGLIYVIPVRLISRKCSLINISLDIFQASELQTSMIEAMEAVEVEKQRHHSTRMEALARLARLEVYILLLLPYFLPL
jgi:hypothetical protein